MAYQRNYGYQYETSPRKLEPEYNPKNNPYKGKKKTTAKKQAQKTKPKQKSKMKPQAQAIIYVAVGFAILFGLSYRNSQITESFSKKEHLKQELSLIQKENEQLQVNIESNLNLSNIEQMAKEKLGMKKLDNSQKVYVSLPKKDYIESASEKVIIEQDLNIWQKIVKGLTQEIK